MRTADCHPDRKHFAKGKCSTCYGREHRRTHPEYKGYMKEYSAKYRVERPEVAAMHYSKRRSDPAKRERDAKVRTNAAYLQKYGMTLEQVEALFEEHSYKCQICDTSLTRTTGQVDHCHATGYVRGVLCVACNTGMGSLGDTLEALEKAVAYLKREPTAFRAAK